MKVFIASFINTALIILIVNIKPINHNIANYDINIPVDDKTGFKVFSGDFYDISSDWYSEVGVKFVFAILIDIIVDYTVTWLGILIKFCNRFYDKHGAKGKPTRLKT